MILHRKAQTGLHTAITAFPAHKQIKGWDNWYAEDKDAAEGIQEFASDMFGGDRNHMADQARHRNYVARTAATLPKEDIKNMLFGNGSNNYVRAAVRKSVLTPAENADYTRMATPLASKTTGIDVGPKVIDAAAKQLYTTNTTGGDGSQYQVRFQPSDSTYRVTTLRPNESPNSRFYNQINWNRK